jgi:O-antigen/teichoic acid export membrane protein
MSGDGLQKNLSLIGDQVLDLGVTFATMVLVEHRYGQEGLGIYSFLLSVFVLVSFLSDLGVTNSVMRSIVRASGDAVKEKQIIGSALQSNLFMFVVVGTTFLISQLFYFDSLIIRHELRTIIIVLLAVPFHSVNNIALSVLHGKGEHKTVGKVRMRKRIFFLVLFFMVSAVKFSLEGLFLVLLISEVFIIRKTLREITMASFNLVFKHIKNMIGTIEGGIKVIFIDGALKALFFIDFFILGLFVSAWDLGVYTEASLIVRFFLLIPLSMRPLYVRKYCGPDDTCDTSTIRDEVVETMKRYFFINALIALFIVIYFPQVMHLLFDTSGEELMAYQLFLVMLPGLLYYATILVSEPIYEKLNKDDKLRRIIWYVFVMNVFLNFYLVPYAGPSGAATATMLSMIVYAVMFIRGLEMGKRLSLFSYGFAGGTLYLAYLLLSSLKPFFLIEIFLIPLVIYVLFMIAGIYPGEEKKVQYNI